MFDEILIVLILVYTYLTQCSQSLSFLPLFAPNGSALCAVDNSYSYVTSSDDILGIPPGVPGPVRCSFYCTEMSSKSTCVGFNYLVQGLTWGTCQFFRQPPSACSTRVEGCMYHEVSSSNKSSACKATSVCDGSPCLYNGTCQQSVGGFNCTCLSGLAGNIASYEGPRCEILVTNIINLPGVYAYIPVPGVDLSNKSAILVNAQIESDLTVGLTTTQNSYTANTMYEIIIGGWTNTQSVIRKAPQGSNVAVVSTERFLSSIGYRSFWVTWANGVIRVGQGTTIGNSQFMVYSDPTPSPVNFLALTAWNGVAAGSAFVKVIP